MVGFAGSEKNPSRQCDNASIPVAAISRGGKVRARSGSQIATRGTRRGLRVPTAGLRGLSCRAATGELSLPVPTVVGMATSGATWRPIRSGLPCMSAAEAGPPPASAATNFAVSSTEPPPRATIPSQPDCR